MMTAFEDVMFNIHGGFRCIQCQKFHAIRDYKPFCCFCGAKQPAEEDIEKLKLSLGPCSDKRLTYDLEEIKTILHKYQGFSVRVNEYGLSHKTLLLEIKLSDEAFDSLYLSCIGTDFIKTPTDTWNSELEIAWSSYRDKTKVVLTDKIENFRIECGAVWLFVDKDLDLSGSS